MRRGLLSLLAAVVITCSGTAALAQQGAGTIRASAVIHSSGMYTSPDLCPADGTIHSDGDCHWD